MGRRASQQSTMSKGETDPDLSERLDLEAHWDSVQTATNCVFHPQGGVSDRGGLQLCSDPDIIASGVARRLRRRIIPLAVTAANVTAFNGGIVANLVDQDPATTFVSNAATSALFVLFEIDLAAAAQVDFLDLISFSSQWGAADNVVLVQFWNGTAWTNFGDSLDVPVAKHIRSTARTRRFGCTPGGPGGTPVVSRQWRVVIQNGIGLGQITIGGVQLWAEAGGLTPVRVREVARSPTVNYQLVITERNIDVFANQRYQASIPIAVAAQQVTQLTYAGGFDTLLLFQKMVPTVRVVRQGTAGEWNADRPPFVNVPAFNTNAVYSGDQDEIQQIDLSAVQPGTSLAFMFGDVVLMVANFTTVAATIIALRAAFFNAPNVVNNSSVLLIYQVAASESPQIATASTGGNAIQVRFTGVNGNRAWPLLSVIANDPNVQVTTQVVQTGLLSSGLYMDDKTGWPACGAFVQQRLMVAGFRGAPTSYVFSRNPNYWDFTNTGNPLTADIGLIGALAVQDVENINGCFVGRHIQVFSETAEWWAQTATIDATSPLGFVRSTTNGMLAGMPLAYIDGATIFVQAGGRTLRQFLYVDLEINYHADPLSVLAPHLITGVADVGTRVARSVSEGNLVVMVNCDGSAAAFTLQRSQNIISGAPWYTDGLFVSVVGSITHDLFFVTQRSGDYYLERWMPSWPLDWETRQSGVVRSVVTGAAYLNGRSDVWAIADGEMIGPLTVSGGSFTLPIAAADVSFGLLPYWKVRTHVLKDKPTQGQPFRPPVRIYEVDAALAATGSIRIGTNGSQTRPVALQYTNDTLIDGGPLQPTYTDEIGLPVMQRLFTGIVKVQGILGVSRDAFIDFERDGPAPVHLKAVRLEYSTKD